MLMRLMSLALSKLIQSVRISSHILPVNKAIDSVAWNTVTKDCHNAEMPNTANVYATDMLQKSLHEYLLHTFSFILLPRTDSTTLMTQSNRVAPLS